MQFDLTYNTWAQKQPTAEPIQLYMRLLCINFRFRNFETSSLSFSHQFPEEDIAIVLETGTGSEDISKIETSYLKGLCRGSWDIIIMQRLKYLNNCLDVDYVIIYFK